jgi:hypothetical protein
LITLHKHTYIAVEDTKQETADHNTNDEENKVDGSKLKEKYFTPKIGRWLNKYVTLSNFSKTLYSKIPPLIKSQGKLS